MFTRREFLKELAGGTTGIFFVNCGLMSAAISRQGTRGKGMRRQIILGGERVLTVDIHTHCTVDIRDLVKDHEEARSDPLLIPNQLTSLDPTSLESRLRHMDERGIDIQAVSLFPSYNYWADRDLAGRIVERQNQKISELCTAYPDRFVGLGGLALQHPDLAVDQMEYAVKELGLRGFEIDGGVNGEELSTPRLNLFWAKAEELGILIFVHPAGFPEGQRRFQGNGFLTNVIGNPLQTTVALSHLIFEGTLDRFPGVKICAAHGGGYMASYLGRSNRCADASRIASPSKSSRANTSSNKSIAIRWSLPRRDCGI